VNYVDFKMHGATTKIKTIQCSYAILAIIPADNVHYKTPNVVHNESEIIQS